MIAFIARRIALSIPTLIGVLVVTFLLLYVAPGDPVQEMVGERADSATIARLRKELRLDEPVTSQFAHYAGGILRGDLGTSYITRRPIIQDVLERFPKTLLLAGTAMLFASITGIIIGVLSSRHPNGWFDRVALGAAYLGISFPVYWVGLLLILLFAVTLHWLPPSGYGGVRHLVLPALALGTRSIAFLARVTRSAMLDVLNSDYVRLARAKGVPRGKVILKHALRNSIIPVLTYLGIAFGALLGGALITETVFNWNGIGLALVSAVQSQDNPIVLGVVTYGVAVFVLVNLLVDVSYAFLDPRIRLQ